MDISIFVILLLLVGGFLAYYFFNRKMVVKRKLKASPLVRISDFQHGDVATIKGTVKYLQEPLTAPLSGRPCAQYRVIIEQMRMTRDKKGWEKIIDDERSVPFLIEQDGEFAMVDENYPKSYLVEDRKFRSRILKDAPDKFEDYLKSHGQSSTNGLGANRNIRYREGILEAGEQVSVVGKGIWKKSTEVYLSVPAEQLLIIEAPEDGHVYLSDDPNMV